MKLHQYLWISFMAFGGFAQAQHLDSLRYQLAGLAIDMYFSKKMLCYFSDTLQDLPEPKMQRDTFYWFDPMTYEQIAYTPETYRTQFYPKAKMEYDIEKALWQLRRTIGQKVILISAAPATYKDYLSPNRRDYLPESKALVGKLSKIDTVYWDAKQIRTNLPYRLDNYSEKAGRFYKYSVSGYIWMSEIVFDTAFTTAILQMGVHYADKSGRTGTGRLLFLKKVNHKWIIDKADALWEE